MCFAGRGTCTAVGRVLGFNFCMLVWGSVGQDCGPVWRVARLPVAVSCPYNAVLSFLLPSLKLCVVSFSVSSCCSRGGGTIKVSSVHDSCFPEAKAGRRPRRGARAELGASPKCRGGDFFPPTALCLGLPFCCSIWSASETLVLSSLKAGACPEGSPPLFLRVHHPFPF